MHRPTLHRAVLVALLTGMSGVTAAMGGGSALADALSTAMVLPPDHGELVFDLALASLDRPAHDGGMPLAGRSPAPLVEWVSAALAGRPAGTGWAVPIVPPAVLLAGRPHRTDDGPNFENDRREAIYRAITASPGRYIAELAAATGIPRSTVRYHVRVLEDEGLIRSALIRGKRRCVPSGADRQTVRVEAALDDDSTAPVLDAVARLEPATVTGVAAAIDAAPSTVSYHLDRLAAEDLVERERVGQAVVTRLDPAVHRALGDRDDVGGGDTDAGVG